MPNDDVIRKNLDDASFAGSDLLDTDLSRASLRRTGLRGANLRGAMLAGADLHDAKLDGADLTGADLRDADLTGASLHGVDLDQAATTEGIHLAGAKGFGQEVAHETDDRSAAAHVDEATHVMLLLTQDIAQAARAISSAAANAQGDRLADAERRSVITRIQDLRARRDFVEERLLDLIDESISDHRQPVIDA